MDPQANLLEQLALANEIQRVVDATPEGVTPNIAEQAARLSELALALDKWILSGGFLPARWRS